jgi:hypothetical protein
MLVPRSKRLHTKRVDFTARGFLSKSSHRKCTKYYTGSSGRNNILRSSGCIATPFENIGVQLHKHQEKTAHVTPALTLDRRHIYSGDGIRTRYFHISSRPGGESSMSHWRSNCNHEPLNYLRGLGPCSPSSFKVSATLVPNYTPVIKTSALTSPKQPWPSRPMEVPYLQ